MIFEVAGGDIGILFRFRRRYIIYIVVGLGCPLYRMEFLTSIFQY